MKVYGIIGYPLDHSFSQRYFTEKFQRESLMDCRYETFPIKSIDELAYILEQHPGLLGLNVTIPYKRSVLPYLNDLSSIPSGVHACNCIRVKDGKLIGYNTDVTGFERSLLPHLKDHPGSALILGNGGAAEAVKYVLRKLNIPFTTVSRKKQEGTDLSYDELNETIIKDNNLIINTTPLGTFPDVNACPDIPYSALTSRHHLFDLVYNPEKSLFLQQGEQQGAGIQNGYEMLVIQAEESWKIWNAG